MEQRLSEEDLEKFRSINANLKARGTKKVTVVDDRGSTQTEHWNDRVDANVVVNPIQVGVTVKGD